MGLNLKIGEDIIILLKLYNINEGTLKEICEVVEKPMSYGRIYQIRRDLLKMGILEITKKIREEMVIKRKIKRAVFKINHKNIDKVLCTELPTKILYDRFIRGEIQIMPKYEKDE
jgi:hypothetical protein